MAENVESVAGIGEVSRRDVQRAALRDLVGLARA
jgi:hypothetical protein